MHAERTVIAACAAREEIAERRALGGLLRVGAVALGIAGLMSLPVLFSLHPPTAPERNLEWATQANSTSYRLGWTILVYSVAPLIIGLTALFVVLAATRAHRLALIGLLVTVGSAGVFLSGMAYPVIVMPAAGVVIGEGSSEPILRLLDQIFREPAWIPVFLAGIAYHIGWVIMGWAVWRSGAFPRWVGGLVVAVGVIGMPAFLDVTFFQSVSPLVTAAASLALAVGVWRAARPPDPAPVRMC